MRPHRRPAPFPPGYARAFAEGRHLREMARMRPYPPPMPMPPHRSSAPWLLALVVMPVAAVAVVVMAAALSVAAVFGAISWAAVPLVPMLVVGSAAWASVRRVQRRAALRRGGAAGTAPLPARPAAPPRPDLVWNHARRRFEALRSAYAAYECDPMAVLRLPALADVKVASTARFVDAFAEAQALDTDAFPGPAHAASFVMAVDRAERAWRAAREADSDAERLAAYGRARSELAKLDRAGVVHVPLPAQAVLDEASRGALPA